MTAWLGDLLIAIGVAFALLGGFGIVRLPDFYTRAHAATKPDTLGLILAMLGLALHHGFSVTSAKLLLIALFVAVANPAAAHAIGRSALRAGLQPWFKRSEAER